VCGIVGYIGRREAAPIILEGLKKLEYRGYDSFGVATIKGVIELDKHWDESPILHHQFTQREDRYRSYPLAT
jgi:glucosamine 6-phosphate synthetase-like amidotransferase/phosphosugar isomerase protein